MKKINKKTIEVRRFEDSTPRIARWLLCQQIGVVFYESGLPYARLEQIREYFQRSDVLKEELFETKLK